MRSSPFEKNFQGDENAAAAVEFAIVLPVFIIIMFGMICYGIYFGAANSVQQLAADVARISVAGLDDDERVNLAQLYLERNADAYPLIESQHLSVAFTPAGAGNTQFEVQLSYDARNLPIWVLKPPFPLPDQTIVRSSTIRVGGI